MTPPRLAGITYRAACDSCRWRSGFYRDGNLPQCFAERHRDCFERGHSCTLWECRDGAPVRVVLRGI